MLLKARLGASERALMRVRRRCTPPRKGSLLEAVRCNALGKPKPKERFRRWLVVEIKQGVHILEPWS